MSTIHLDQPSSSFVNYIIHDFWAKDAAEYSAHLPLIGSAPWKIFAATGVYLLFVLKIGPDFMKNRQPYDLRSIINVYNLFHIIANSILGISVLILTRGTYDCWQCKQTGDPNSTLDSVLLMFKYFYFWAKFVDWMDTIFFVLRKKQSQVTFLHVFHHALMPFGTYISLKYVPLGRTYIVGVINSLVHAVMYTYYYLSSQPNYKNIWWKKYLTMIQIVQFLIFTAHGIQGLFIIDCPNYPTWISVIMLGQTLFFVNSFTQFFIRTYEKPKKAQ